MRISAVGSNQGADEYNFIKTEQLRGMQKDRKVASREVQKVVAEEPSAQSVSAAKQEEDARRIEEARSRQTETSYDYAQKYRPGINYDLKGAYSDIKSLDVERALSEMEKDKVLQQYQFFVGDRRMDQAQTNAVLRSGENFSL